MGLGIAQAFSGFAQGFSKSYPEAKRKSEFESQEAERREQENKDRKRKAREDRAAREAVEAERARKRKKAEEDARKEGDKREKANKDRIWKARDERARQEADQSERDEAVRKSSVAEGEKARREQVAREFHAIYKGTNPAGGSVRLPDNSALDEMYRVESKKTKGMSGKKKYTLSEIAVRTAKTSPILPKGAPMFVDDDGKSPKGTYAKITHARRGGRDGSNIILEAREGGKDDGKVLFRTVIDKTQAMDYLGELPEFKELSLQQEATKGRGAEIQQAEVGEKLAERGFVGTKVPTESQRKLLMQAEQEGWSASRIAKAIGWAPEEDEEKILELQKRAEARGTTLEEWQEMPLNQTLDERMGPPKPEPPGFRDRMKRWGADKLDEMIVGGSRAIEGAGRGPIVLGSGTEEGIARNAGLGGGRSQASPEVGGTPTNVPRGTIGGAARQQYRSTVGDSAESAIQNVLNASEGMTREEIIEMMINDGTLIPNG